jgi:hypothetical protein
MFLLHGADTLPPINILDMVSSNTDQVLSTDSDILSAMECIVIRKEGEKEKDSKINEQE